MADEWPTVPVSQFATAVIGGTPSRNVADYWHGDVPWATAKDVAAVPGRYLEHVDERITQEALKHSAAKVLPKGTVIITARGTVGAVAQLGRAMAFNQTCYALLPKGGLDNDFLFYALKGTIAEMRALTYGTVFETITTNTFDHWLVPLPPLPEQRAIAHILGTLDDKIELNRRMTETLEAMARALFKAWFVDFEPVRAKMEGRWQRGHPPPLPLGEGRSEGLSAFGEGNAGAETLPPLPVREGWGEGIPPLPPGEGRGEGPLPTKTHAKLPSDLVAFARQLRRDETDAERLLWRVLRNRRLAGAKFRRQHPFPPYVLDFYCYELKLAIELDGGQHNLPESRLRDKARTAQLHAHGIRVLRFWDHEVLRQTESVLQAIYRAVIERLRELQPSPPAPLPAGEGRTPPGLPAHLYDLFPDRLVDSELGEIPEGWRVVKLEQVIEIGD
jgi:very-short-patch-repair endonuclease